MLLIGLSVTEKLLKLLLEEGYNTAWIEHHLTHVDKSCICV